MATQLQLRRGTTSQVAAFTGANGEVVVDTEKKTLFVNDGSTAGGLEIARADFSNISASATLTVGTLTATTFTSTGIDDNGTATAIEIGSDNFVTVKKDGTTKVILTDTSSPETHGAIQNSNGVVTIAADTGNAQSGSNIHFEVDGTEMFRIPDTGDMTIPDGSLTITTADNTTQLTLKSTDADADVGPRLDLVRDSSTPEANDYLGVIRWVGEDDDNNALSYAHMSTYISDPTDGAEDGKFEIDTRVGGAMRSRLLIHSTSTIFNQEGQDLDFRIESSNKTYMFYCDAGNDRIGIGTATPTEMLAVDDEVDGEVAVKIQNDSTGSSAYASLFLQGQGNNFKIKNWGDGTSDANITEFVSTAGSSEFVFAPGSTEKVRISNSGELAVGTSNPDSLVHISGSGGTAVLRFENPDTGLSTNEVIGKLEFETQDAGGAGVNAYIQAAGNNTSGAAYISFGTGTGGSTVEAARFDSSRRLLIGTTEAITTNTTGKLQMAGTSSAASTFNISRFSADASSGALSFAKSRDASIGGNTVVSSGDNLGSINFHGDDGTDTATMAAKILAEVDGTPGSNDMPGRLAFFTTPDNQVSPSERVRINCTGDLLHGTTVVPTGVKLGRHLVSSSSTGSEIIAFRKDTSVAAGNLCGALLIGNSDTSGVEDHFVGLWGKVVSSNGSQSLNFAAGRSGYEDDAPQVTLTSAGELVVGSTTEIRGSDQTGVSVEPEGRIYLSRGTSTGGFSHLAFYNGNGLVGTVQSSGSATSYNTSSDNRLKSNIAPADDAGSKIDAIQVRQFDWIADGTHQDYGMVAQELLTVAPEAVNQPEDPEEMMGVDYSKLVPMLVKEIQSLRARVNALEAE